jgi:hypothetical protein
MTSRRQEVKIKANEVGRACSTHGRVRKYVKKFGRNNQKERDNLEDIGIDRRKILEWILQKWGVDWQYPDSEKKPVNSSWEHDNKLVVS